MINPVMGNEISKVHEEGFKFYETVLSDFCGRRKDVDEIVRLITKKNIKTLCVHGAKSIGKTRVINQVLMNKSLKSDFHQICHIDCSEFEEDCVDKNFIPFIKDFYESLGLKTNWDPCGACDLCKQNTGCTKLKYKKLLKEFTLALKDVNVPTLICFDDADRLLVSSFGPEFLDFIKTVTEKREKIKILVGSTVRFHLIIKAKETHLVDKMDSDELKKLIVQILEPDEYDENYLKKLSALRIRDSWLEALAILCDGIPLCAELLGTYLKEDGYFLEPVEIVQLLLTDYIEMLNPALFAKSERPAAIYADELRKFTEAREQRWLFKIAETMKESTITAEEGLKAVRADGSQVTMGTFKMEGLRKMLDNSILQKDKTSEELSMQRLYQHLLVNLLHLVGNKDNDELNLRSFIGEQGLALIKEEAKSIGLDFDHHGNLNAVQIERVLYRRDQQLKRDDSGNSSGEEHEDDSGNESNDSGRPHEEHCHEQGLFFWNGSLDSTSGPPAMSYRPNGKQMIGANRMAEEATLSNPLVSDFNGLTINGHNDNHGETSSRQAELDVTGRSHVRRLTNDTEKESIDESENLNNNALRKALKPVDTKPKREQHSSTNELCISHFHRMSSQDYEVSIKNEYINIGEAKHSQGQDDIVQRVDKIHVRYSDSSTDSGEIKLWFETNTFPNEM